LRTKKNKLILALSILVIVSLIISFPFSTIKTKALLEDKQNFYNRDSFETIVRKWSITDVVSTESTGYSYYPSIATDDLGNVHVVWTDETDYLSAGGDYDIFYKLWNATSSSWTTTEVVSTESTADSEFPSIATDSSGDLHIAWHDDTNYDSSGSDQDIFYKSWDKSTNTWSTTEVVSTESTAASGYCSISIDILDNVHITWQDNSNYDSSGSDQDIFYKRWDTSSLSWTTTEVVSTESTSTSRDPSVSTDASGCMHVAWSDITDYSGSGGDFDIFYKRWDTSSSSWTTTEVVSTESTGSSSYPSIACDAIGNAYIVWFDLTNYSGSGTDQDVFYKSWDKTESSWTTTEVVSTESTSTSGYFNCAIAVDMKGNIHIAWYDETNYAGSDIDRDIFYKRWNSNTFSWTISEVVSTESYMDSYYPSIVVDSAGNMFITWFDFTSYAGSGGDWDIFYKHLLCIPEAPELAYVLQNPTNSNQVFLDWNSIPRISSYHIYRSTSYIWVLEGLIPLTVVSTSEYMDYIPTEGFYYYVIVAENIAGKSPYSNCQYVEVRFPDLEAPELAIILPNPTDLTSISLVWDDIDGATNYYVYRSDTYIWSVDGLIPIAIENSNSYVDALPAEGNYFYVIVATDGVRNSTHSNCVYVVYELPHVQEFVIISGLILGTFVILFIHTRTRKKNLKWN
jgi:ribosomal protein L31